LAIRVLATAGAMPSARPAALMLSVSQESTNKRRLWVSTFYPFSEY
jgi:hypothetical protein